VNGDRSLSCPPDFGDMGGSARQISVQSGGSLTINYMTLQHAVYVAVAAEAAVLIGCALAFDGESAFDLASNSQAMSTSNTCPRVPMTDVHVLPAVYDSTSSWLRTYADVTCDNDRSSTTVRRVCQTDGSWSSVNPRCNCCPWFCEWKGCGTQCQYPGGYSCEGCHGWDGCSRASKGGYQSWSCDNGC
jgi:hypothetical protein